MNGVILKFIINIFISIALLTLTSCSSGRSSSNNLQLHGVVQSGNNNPHGLAGYSVNMYQAGSVSAKLIAQTITNKNGDFNLDISSNVADSQFYITATHESIELAVFIGSNVESKIVINELTTVAMAYSLAQFLHEDKIYGNNDAIQIASEMNQNVVSITTGLSSYVITNAPNAKQTNAWMLTNTLSNAIAACVNNSSLCQKLFALSNSINGNLSINTLDVIHNLALNPAQHINEIMDLAISSEIYSPSLLLPPDAWTLALKFNQTGSVDCPFGGPGNFVFDKNGYLWITNNVVQGTPYSTNCMIVLKPNGMPADGVGATVKSPVYGGGILGAGFGISIDAFNKIWLGNFGWGGVNPNGSVSEKKKKGVPLFESPGLNNLVYQVQDLQSDSQNNMWIASNGNQRIVIYPSGNQNNAIYASTLDGNPFDFAISNLDEVWVSFNNKSNVAKYKLSSDGKSIELLHLVDVGGTPIGINLDSQDNLWVSSFNESFIHMVSPNGDHVESFSGGGIVKTWDVAIDGDDNIYAMNFFPNSNNTYGIAKLCGISVKNCPHGAVFGTPISPPNGYTLPTGGNQVLLSNGEPLYGAGGVPDFHPLMRMTSGKVDKAGNLWVTNNWKPDFAIDLTTNPGGDGMVAFLGLAKPIDK